ncbi:uncharacterized protein BKA78DRAFT_314937 [Phyllosticta capitalensis]|uniref:uncharacterized protein n=1 Tax=Phyllosticta capitalensis TaxID=121624 RepID=UPI00312E41CF
MGTDHLTTPPGAPLVGRQKYKTCDRSQPARHVPMIDPAMCHFEWPQCKAWRG